MLVQREVLLAKIESTYNTDPVPVEGTDAMLVENLQWAHSGLKMVERNPVRPSLGQLKQLYAGSLVTFSFDVEIKGSGSAGTAPEFGPLLRACALGETIVGATSVTYAPASSGHESITCYYYQDGTLLKLTGGRGNVSINLEAGGKGVLSFEITGHVSAITDIALASPTYDSTVPPAVIGGAFTIDAFAAIINALTCDMANQIATPGNISASDGYGEVQIVSRDINGSFDPEHELVAVEDFRGNFTGGAAMALATGSIGGTAGNIYALTMPAVSYRDVSPGDRDAIRTLELPYGAHESSTDDEISLAFT